MSHTPVYIYLVDNSARSFFFRPVTFHVAACSSIDKGDKAVVLGDHTELVAVSQTGFTMIGSQDVQEAQDMALVSHIVAQRTQTGVLHFFDGNVVDTDARTSLRTIDDKLKALAAVKAAHPTSVEVQSTDGSDSTDASTSENEASSPTPIDVAQVTTSSQANIVHSFLYIYLASVRIFYCSSLSMDFITFHCHDFRGENRWLPM